MTQRVSLDSFRELPLLAEYIDVGAVLSILNLKKFSFFKSPLLLGLLLVGTNLLAQSHDYVTPEEQELLAKKKADADQMIGDFFQRAIKELRPDIVKMAARYGRNMKNVVSSYLTNVENIYKIGDNSMAAMIQGLGYMHAFKGTTVPASLVNKVFNFFAEEEGMNDDHKKAISDWFENQLAGVWIDVDKQGLVVLRFIPKNKRQTMRLEFSDGGGEDAMAMKLAISPNNSFVFKNRNVKSRWGKIEYLYNDIQDFFSHRGLLTDKMDLISLSKEELLNRHDTYARSQASKLAPLFLEIKGFEFSVDNTGIPAAGLLSPSVDRLVILPNFSEMRPSNYMADDIYMRINSIVNAEIGL